MNVSSIAAPTPVSPPSPTTSQTTPDVQPDGNADDATETQPPVVAALPPGQGTRIDQIV
jgi:hypothetical protein